MNREDIIRMAREAEIHTYPEWMHGVPIVALERFAALVAAAEREACALECEDGASTPEELLCAKLIRARGQQ